MNLTPVSQQDMRRPAVQRQPRKGPLGLWDAIVGPGATPGENLGTLLCMLTGGVAAPLSASLRGFDWSAAQYAVAALAGLDIVGGMWANATLTTRRWYHRPGQGFWSGLGFASLHVYPFLVAWLYRGNDWSFAFESYGYLLLAYALVTLAPRRVQRPLAVAFFAGALLLDIYLWRPTPGLEWFIPALFLKLLIGHAPAIETASGEASARVSAEG